MSRICLRHCSLCCFSVTSIAAGRGQNNRLEGFGRVDVYRAPVLEPRLPQGNQRAHCGPLRWPPAVWDRSYWTLPHCRTFILFSRLNDRRKGETNFDAPKPSHPVLVSDRTVSCLACFIGMVPPGRELISFALPAASLQVLHGRGCEQDRLLLSFDESAKEAIVKGKQAPLPGYV